MIVGNEARFNLYFSRRSSISLSTRIIYLSISETFFFSLLLFAQ